MRKSEAARRLEALPKKISRRAGQKVRVKYNAKTDTLLVNLVFPYSLYAEVDFFEKESRKQIGWVLYKNNVMISYGYDEEDRLLNEIEVLYVANNEKREDV